MVTGAKELTGSDFTVSRLRVMPPLLMEGQRAIVTAEVTNSGLAEYVFGANL